MNYHSRVHYTYLEHLQQILLSLVQHSTLLDAEYGFPLNQAFFFAPTKDLLLLRQALGIK